MTANDLFQLFVGEIGIPRREFLYDICFWEARRIIRGYRNRYRDMWTAMRWHAFNLMSAMPYCDLQKAGIRNPTDLMKFEWDKRMPDRELSDEEIAESEELLKLYKNEKPAP
jgi:hypothetical protein